MYLCFFVSKKTSSFYILDANEHLTYRLFFLFLTTTKIYVKHHFKVVSYNHLISNYVTIEESTLHLQLELVCTIINHFWNAEYLFVIYSFSRHFFVCFCFCLFSGCNCLLQLLQLSCSKLNNHLK